MIVLVNTNGDEITIDEKLKGNYIGKGWKAKKKDSK